jgi:hypothetical protein
MNCHQAEEHVPDYLAARLGEANRQELEAHLAVCDSCREMVSASQEIWMQLSQIPEVKPSPELRARVTATIEAFRQNSAPEAEATATRLGWWTGLLFGWRLSPALQFAFLGLVFAAGFLTRPLFFGPGNQNLALDQLRQEVTSLREMVSLTLLQQPSASDRLDGISWSYGAASQDNKVLSALLHTLESDPNVNVRVAAVDALRQFAGHAEVKRDLLRSLAREQAPYVQIELINLMVELREKESIPVLRQIMQNQAVNLAVRQQAEWGLQQLI